MILASGSTRYTGRMSAYSVIAIIYNPKSTGPSQRNAKSLHKYLTKQLPGIEVQLVKTEHANHAETLAYKITKKYESPLIVSSSGDGGYNEVINGALRGASKGHTPICAVLPSGNANDHARALQNRPLKKQIIKGSVENIDILKATITNKDKKTVRFAHSYIGMGLTPEIASELNKNKLTPSKELWITLKTFWNYDALPIAKRGSNTSIQSFICSNIPHMAKRLTLAKDAKADDGTYELWLVTQATKLEIIRQVAKAAFARLDPPKRTKRFSFTVVRDAQMQLDGEIMELKNNSKVQISLKHKALRTII